MDNIPILCDFLRIHWHTYDQCQSTVSQCAWPDNCILKSHSRDVLCIGWDEGDRGLHRCVFCRPGLWKWDQSIEPISTSRERWLYASNHTDIVANNNTWYVNCLACIAVILQQEQSNRTRSLVALVGHREAQGVADIYQTWSWPIEFVYTFSTLGPHAPVLWHVCCSVIRKLLVYISTQTVDKLKHVLAILWLHRWFVVGWSFHQQSDNILWHTYWSSCFWTNFAASLYYFGIHAVSACHTNCCKVNVTDMSAWSGLWCFGAMQCHAQCKTTMRASQTCITIVQ